MRHRVGTLFVWMPYPLASFPRFGVLVMATVCSRCNAKLGWIASTLSAGSTDALCPACIEESLDTATAEEADSVRQMMTQQQMMIQLSKSVKVTTTPTFDGYHVVEYLGIESVEFVIGTGMFSEVSSSLADFFGARSSAFEQKLQAAKRHAMDALKYIAAKRGANAVLAIDLDYTEFSGNRIALIINGTLVRIEPHE
jgi:uncharacterized protein YbjQ (UPF0145 family)